MTDMLRLVGDISMAVKVGWLVWVVWAAAVIVWYRYGRVEVMVPLPASRSRTDTRTSAVSVKRPVSSPKPLSSLSTGGSPEFLAALGLDQPKAAEPAPVTTPDESVYS